MQKELLKEKIKDNYSKIALRRKSNSCCGPLDVYDTINNSRE
jgi:hypothetical protein